MAKTKSPIMQALFGSALACALVIVGVWAAKEYWSVDIPAHVASAMTTIATVIGTVIEHLVGFIKQWHPRPRPIWGLGLCTVWPDMRSWLLLASLPAEARS